MTFWKVLKKKFKLILGISLLGALLSPMILPAASAQADGPRFNFMDGDYKTLRGANLTNGETVWKDPVTGTAGDIFEGLIYYHNGMIDTTANNTTIKVSIPSTLVNGAATISASISADNASTVNDTLGVVASDSTKLEFIPGSVLWFPNQKENPGVTQTLPSGQTGNEIVTAAGLNIGGIQGCWNFAGFVKFKFKAVKIQPANIVQSKIAKDLNSGIEGTDINANLGDDVLYTLTTKNTGGTAESVIVKDDVSDILELSDIGTISNSGVLTSGTITWPSVLINPGQTVINTFKVKVKNPLPTTPQSGLHFDFIMFNVYGNSVFVRLPKPTPVVTVPNLTIAKSVRNVTAGATNFVKSNEAMAGDTLEYRVDFANTGDGNADNVLVSDSLPANVAYQTGTAVLSVNDGAEQTIVDGITATGITLNLASKSHGYFKFKVVTSKNLAGGEILTNTSFLKFDSKTINDTAVTKIKKVVVAPITTPELPKTGAENVVLSFLVTFAGGIGTTYLKFRKKLALLSSKF